MKTVTTTSYATLGLVLLLTGLLVGCAPTITSYQLEPASGDIASIDGRSVTKASANGVQVVASFEREDLEFVVLDLEIQNHTDHPISINPADIHFTALGANQDTLGNPTNASLPLAGSAADPTYELGQLNAKRRQVARRLTGAKVFNTILMVATIASDVSSSSRNRSYRDFATNRIVHNMAYQGIAIKRSIDYSTFANRMQRLDYEEYRWRELALKPGEVAPAQSVRGLVYLRKIPDARYLALTYTTPDQTSIPFLFKQALVQQPSTSRKR